MKFKITPEIIEELKAGGILILNGDKDVLLETIEEDVKQAIQLLKIVVPKAVTGFGASIVESVIDNLLDEALTWSEKINPND